MECLVFLVLVAVPVFEEDGLGRLGFSDLCLKDEQHLSIKAVYKGSSIFLLALGRAYVMKSSLL